MYRQLLSILIDNLSKLESSISDLSADYEKNKTEIPLKEILHLIKVRQAITKNCDFLDDIPVEKEYELVREARLKLRETAIKLQYLLYVVQGDWGEREFSDSELNGTAAFIQRKARLYRYRLLDAPQIEGSSQSVSATNAAFFKCNDEDEKRKNLGVKPRA